MSDEPKGMLQTAVTAVNYSRVMGLGFLGLIALMMLLAAFIYWFPINGNNEIAKIVLDFLKMAGSAIIGALCQSHRGTDKPGGE
jgi:uncharacterized membrane protein YukC